MPGGQNFNRNRSGDPEAKPAFVLLDPKQQRDAMTMLGETLFNDNFFSRRDRAAQRPGPLALVGLGQHAEHPHRLPDPPDDPEHAELRAVQPLRAAGACSASTTPSSRARPTTSSRPPSWSSSTRHDHLGRPGPAARHRSSPTPSRCSAASAATSSASTCSTCWRRWTRTPGQLVSPDLQSMVAFSLRELSDQMGVVLDKAKTANNGKLDFATKAHLQRVQEQDRPRAERPARELPGPGDAEDRLRRRGEISGRCRVAEVCDGARTYRSLRRR